jgi:hypothetical protein
VLYILRINGIKIRFTKREVMNGIQDICFAFPVIPQKAIYLRIQADTDGRTVLEID